MIYDRRFGLPQSMINYLNQPLPDISGILSLPVAQSEPISNQEVESLTTTGLTPEQLALLYPQPQMGGGEGGYQDEDTTIGDGSTLGIDSFGDVMDFGKKNIGTIAATSLFGLPAVLGFKAIQNLMDPHTNIFGQSNAAGKAAQKKTMDEARALSKKATEAAAAQGVTGFKGYGTSQQRGAALHGDGGDGPSGPSGPGANSSGVGGGADAATW